MAARHVKCFSAKEDTVPEQGTVSSIGRMTEKTNILFRIMRVRTRTETVIDLKRRFL